MPCPPEILEELDIVADEMCDLDAVNTLDRYDCVEMSMSRLRVMTSRWRNKYVIYWPPYLMLEENLVYSTDRLSDN